VYYLVAFLIAGFVFGLLEHWLWTGGSTTIAASFFSAIFASVTSLVWGLAVAITGSLLIRVPFVAFVKRRWHEWISTSANENRQEAAHRLARVLVALLLLALAPLPLRKIFQYLWSLQDSAIALELAVATAVLSAVAITTVWYVFSKLLGRFLACLDQRIALPWPHRPSLRVFLFLVCPAIAVIVPFAARNRDSLGRIATGLELFALPLMALPLAMAIAGVRQNLSSIARRLWISATTIIYLAAILACVTAYDHCVSDARLAETGPAAAVGANVLRSLSDFDRDHAPAIFGGADCAPFDANRGPRALDIGGNGIDENCDGQDSPKNASSLVASKPELFYGRLPSERVKKYNIVWMIIEAVRADHVGALGYRIPTTPAIDALAADSWLFSKAYSHSSATLLAFPSFLTGRNPTALQWEWIKGRPQLKKNHKTAAERLAAVGYHSGLIVNGYLTGRAVGLHQGYDEVITVRPVEGRIEKDKSRYSPISAMHAIKFVEGILNREGEGSPFLLTVYFPDAHAPYERHEENKSSELGKLAVSAYDEEIAFTDRYVGFLVDYLRNRPPVWENTIVIVHADHGEEFRERGNRFHARTCYEESVHVPLIVMIPGMKARRIDTPVGLVDLLPTLLELLGIKPDAGDELDGQSLLIPVFSPQLIAADRPLFCAVVSQSATAGDFYRTAVRWAGFGFFYDFKNGRSELYDLERDPRETRDISADPVHRARVRLMKEMLESVRTGNLGSYADF
jgi:arylsulfatase A-like enzyme